MPKLQPVQWFIVIFASAVIGTLVAGSQTMSDAMVQAGWCAKDDSICLLGRYAEVIFALLVCIILFALLWSVITFGASWLKKHQVVSRATKYLQTCDPQNIHLVLGSAYGNEYTLQVCNREWRGYPFKSRFVFADVRFSPEKGELEWRAQKTSSSIPMKWRSCAELSFLRVNDVENAFYVMAKHDTPNIPKSRDPIERIKFPAGTWWFGVSVVSRSSPQCPEFDVVTQYTVEVTYKGSNQLQMEVKNVSKNI